MKLPDINEPLPAEVVFNAILNLLHKVQVLNVRLDHASEVELYRIRELKDPSRSGENVNFFVTALMSQVIKLDAILEREE